MAAVFTGIIQSVGRVSALEPRGDDCRLRIQTSDLPLQAVRSGDSIAVNGVCLTVVDVDGACFAADVSAETLRCTTLQHLDRGARVNLEPALTPSTPLGGHLVSGHVDGIGELLSREPDARSVHMRFRAPRELCRYIARKGSVCIDGVSLTVNDLHGDAFDINIVPHTLTHTTFDEFEPGRAVNLEVDLLARYLERLLDARAGDA